tara:strand:- start:7567 stop:8052 length:486 start_codon:yes stop_codon:yes gene_type:complete
MKKSFLQLPQLPQLSLKLLSKKMVKSLMVITVLLFTILVIRHFFNMVHEGFEVTPSKFDSTLGKSGKKLVLFYADWCPHCTKFKPTWESVCDSVNNAEDKKMISINVGDSSSDSKNIMKEYNVNGFPTIVLIDQTNNKKSIEAYEGGRDKSSLESYVNKNL